MTKGNITVVKKSTDSIANGNYITSEGKEGDSAWSTRATWCKMYARMGNDSVSVAIIDHPSNPIILLSGMQEVTVCLPPILWEKKYSLMVKVKKISN
jgi:hypothetical protein